MALELVASMATRFGVPQTLSSQPWPPVLELALAARAPAPACGCYGYQIWSSPNLELAATMAARAPGLFFPYLGFEGGSKW